MRKVMFMIHQHDKDTLDIINTYKGYKDAANNTPHLRENQICNACQKYPKVVAGGYKWSKEVIKRWK